MPSTSDDPKKFRAARSSQAHQVAMNMLRPISRKYDRAEHEYPKELDMLAAMIDGLAESGASEGAGAAGVKRDERAPTTTAASRTAPTWPRCSRSPRCAGATSACCCRCRARASATPRSPRSPTTSSRSASRASGPRWRSPSPAPARTPPTSRPPPSATATSTSSTARRSSSPPASAPTPSSSGRRSTSPSAGRRSSRSSSPKGTPGMRVERLEHKLGIRASDTATIAFDRLPGAGGEPARLAGDRHRAGLRRRDGDLRQHPAAGRRDGRRLRPGVAGPDPRAARRRPASSVDYDRPALTQSAAAATFLQMEADWEAAHLLTLQAAWMADNRKPNSLEASMAKAKAGRVGSDITLAASSSPARSATARASCSRSGRATPRSSTSSRAPSRSSS